MTSSSSRTDTQNRLQPKLEAANINPTSFLATDYLNHFNEIVMTLEMVPDMPELVEDACDWKPKSYTDHFRDSGFQAKDLAIEAFENAPSEFLVPFETIREAIDQLVMSTLHGLGHVGAAERGLSEAAQHLIRGRVTEIQDQLMVLNGIIHGRTPDETPAETLQDSDAGDDAQTQEDIDRLFD